MPIEFLNDRNRLNRVGRIRLGHKVPTAKGGERPVADPFFNVPDELKEFYGDKPTTLHIRFISNDLETTFPFYLRWYTKSCLRCLGDGQRVIYQVNDAGVKTVSDYCMLDAGGKIVMNPAPGACGVNGEGPKRVACEGEICPHYDGGDCKPTGYLRFVVEEHLRQGYYDVVCHQRAVVGIKTQLELALRMFGRIVDIPFLLHRGDAEQIPVRTPQGVKNMPVRTQWVEIEPTWFQTAFMRRPKVLVESQQQRQLEAQAAVALLYGGVEDSSEAAKIPPLSSPEAVDELSEPAFEGEGGETNGDQAYDAETAAQVVKSEVAPEYTVRAAAPACGAGGKVEPESAPIPPKPHWAEDPKQCTLFWMWAKDKGLSNKDAQSILGLESIKDYPGTMVDLKKAIEAALAQKVAT